MSHYILAIDQGTTGSTALLIDESLSIIGKKTIEFHQYFPKVSWVEHDLEDIWSSVCNAVRGCMLESGISPRQVFAIGITNQRETTCLWSRDERGTPFCRAIVWQDRRTAEHCDRLKKKGLEKLITRRTGLLLDPYFSASKLAWLLKNQPGSFQLAKSGKLIFGTVDSFLLYRISGQHRTDPSNASRTMLMNIQTCEWDSDMLSLFKIPRQILPEIFPSAIEYGSTKKFLDFPDGIPITGIAGDQQAALFGQACFERGEAKCTYGTGAFVLANIGNKPISSHQRLLTTVAWKLNGKVTYGLEGSAFIAGAVVQWLRDGLNIISKSPEVEGIAGSVPDADGVVFVPALSGMGAPHWLAHAHGLLYGLTRRTTKAHLARAALEGIAFQVAELLEAVQNDFGKRISELKVDGGASENDLLMQIQANLMGVKVIRSRVTETTALGVGLQAGLGIGLWKNLDEIRSKWKKSKEFDSKISTQERKTEKVRWNKAIQGLKLLSQRHPFT